MNFNLRSKAVPYLGGARPSIMNAVSQANCMCNDFKEFPIIDRLTRSFISVESLLAEREEVKEEPPKAEPIDTPEKAKKIIDERKKDALPKEIGLHPLFSEMSEVLSRRIDLLLSITDWLGEVLEDDECIDLLKYELRSLKKSEMGGVNVLSYVKRLSKYI